MKPFPVAILLFVALLSTARIPSYAHAVLFSTRTVMATVVIHFNYILTFGMSLKNMVDAASQKLKLNIFP